MEYNARDVRDTLSRMGMYGYDAVDEDDAVDENDACHVDDDTECEQSGIESYDEEDDNVVSTSSTPQNHSSDTYEPVQTKSILRANLHMENRKRRVCILETTQFSNSCMMVVQMSLYSFIIIIMGVYVYSKVSTIQCPQHLVDYNITDTSKVMHLQITQFINQLERNEIRSYTGNILVIGGSFQSVLDHTNTLNIHFNRTGFKFKLVYYGIDDCNDIRNKSICDSIHETMWSHDAFINGVQFNLSVCSNPLKDSLQVCRKRNILPRPFDLVNTSARSYDLVYVQTPIHELLSIQNQSMSMRSILSRTRWTLRNDLTSDLRPPARLLMLNTIGWTPIEMLDMDDLVCSVGLAPGKHSQYRISTYYHFFYFFYGDLTLDIMLSIGYILPLSLKTYELNEHLKECSGCNKRKCATLQQIIHRKVVPSMLRVELRNVNDVYDACKHNEN